MLSPPGWDKLPGVARSPSGTVTFLLTDVEASARAWESDAATTAAVMARHEEILAAAIAAHGGFRAVEQGEGDSVVAAFNRASAAVAAAVEAQLGLAREPWPTPAPIRVRIALHTGEAEPHGGRYAGSTIIRTARLRAVAHGGQTIVSRATAELVHDALPDGTTLVDLGSHRLRDLTRAEQIFQISHTELPSAFPPLQSLDRVANNLPAQLTSFIGREAELAQVERLLAEGRLLTLTGAGGCGKTRLAAHAAASVAGSHPCGVWWIELAPLGAGSSVSTAVLAAIGLREHPSRSAVDQLVDHFGQGRALLVLDNCEHLLDAVVGLIEPLLGRSPELTVLATSREPLGLAGETTWRVPPLALPMEPGPSTPEALTAYDAVALFVDRARQARPNFVVTNGNAPAVAEICARLDGIPLAIELAAARVRVLSPEGIREGLNDRFRLLTGGAKRGLARQQTLAASVEWSYDLLGDDERTMLQRLAVFSGGFTLDGAEAVAAGGDIEALRVLDLLTALVDKSLVVADDEPFRVRYRLLETIRQFALTRLASSGEAEAIRDAHAKFHLQFAEQAAVAFMTDDELLSRQEPEHDNLRAALEWALDRGAIDDAITLLVGLANLWMGRGLLREAKVWFDRVLGHPGFESSPVRYRAWWARALMAVIDGIPHPALGMAGAVTELATAAGDRLYMVRSLWVEGVLTVMADPAPGEKRLLEVRRVADEIGDLHSSRWARIGLVTAGIHRGDHELAARYFEEAEPLLDGATGQTRAMSDALFGFSEVRAGRFEAARRHGEAARRMAAEIGDPTLAGAQADLTMVLVELGEGRIDAAAEVLDAVLREPRRSGPTRNDPMLTGARGCVLAERGDVEAAKGVMAEAVRMARDSGDGEQIAACLGWGAALLRSLGNGSEARLLAGNLLAHGQQQANPRFEAVALRELGQLSRLDGELEVADDLTHRALALCAEARILPDVQQSLVAVAGVAAAGESWEEAVRLFGAAERLGADLGSALPVWDRTLAEADLELARRSLEPEAFEAAYGEGRALAVDQAVAYAERGRGERKRPSSGWAGLTPMERQVVDLVAEGLRNADIAARLFVAPSTIKTHLAHAFAKLDVSTRAELAALVTRRHGSAV
jgi:predicted ATPase/class 3 adenylate cyclase/DNA-binding CsgD family transcriptional regulator